MHIIKLNAIGSTNSYLKALLSATKPKDFTVVFAEHQYQGRGQMGSHWQVEAGKNLTFSVLKQFYNFNIEAQFYISMATALAVYNALNTLNIPKLRIKWPNDILSANKKIGGILIENSIKHKQIEHAVIGIGINVNQDNFEDLTQASSLKTICEKSFDIEMLLDIILDELQLIFNLLKEEKLTTIRQHYEAVLFRKDKPSTFEIRDKTLFNGIIKGVSKTGNLIVQTQAGELQNFDIKEVKLLY